MAGLPAGLLLGFSAIIWFLRKRHIRTIWIVTLTAFVIAWVVLIVLMQFLPDEITVFDRQPLTAFLESPRFELNSANVVLVAATLSLGVVSVLTFQRRQDFTDPIEFFFISLLGGFGLLTIMPASFPAFAIMWVAWEILTILVFSLHPKSPVPIRLFRGRMLKQLGSVLLMITVGAMLASRDNKNSVATSPEEVGILLLGISTVLLRMDLFDGEHPILDEGSHHSTLSVWVQGISAVSGLAFFGQLFKDGAPGSVHSVIVAIGVCLCLLAVLRIPSGNELAFNLTTYALGILGVGLILLRLLPSNHSGIMETLSAILLLSVSAMIVPIRFHPWNYIAALSSGLIAVGAPFTIGAQVVTAIVEVFQSGQGLILASVSAVTLALISILPLKSHATDLRTAQTDLGKTGISGAIIPIFILATGTILGISSGIRINIPSVGYFGATVLILGVLAFVRWRRRVQFQVSIPPLKLERAMSIIGPGLQTLNQLLGNALNITARIFEGRAGLLWVYVILLFVLVALGYTG